MKAHADPIYWEFFAAVGEPVYQSDNLADLAVNHDLTLSRDVTTETYKIGVSYLVTRADGTVVAVNLDEGQTKESYGKQVVVLLAKRAADFGRYMAAAGHFQIGAASATSEESAG